MIESKLHIMATNIFPGNKRDFVVQKKTDFQGNELFELRKWQKTLLVVISQGERFGYCLTCL